MNVNSVRDLIQQVNNGNIDTAVEFIFNLAPFVQDQGIAFKEILEKDICTFRETVDEIINHKIQDEADVMMLAQADVKRKLKNLTDETIRRTIKIKDCLHDISPKFDWAIDGKNKAKLNKLIKKETQVNKEESQDFERMHQIFMRGQWFKKELRRVLKENATLKALLCEYRKLAAERKVWDSKVPQMLRERKKNLEKELMALKRTHNTNMESIDTFYVEYQRCLQSFNKFKA